MSASTPDPLARQMSTSALPVSHDPNENAKRVTSFVIGVVFGLAMEKAKLIYPEVIVGQMKMQSFQMLKAFLAASAVSMLTFAVMVHLGWSARFVRAKISFGFMKLRGYGANVSGGLLLGAGMALAGSCPGTIFPQLGAGVSSARYVLLGCLLGAYLYGFKEYLMKLVLCRFGYCGDRVCIDERLGVPYWLLSCAIGSVLMVTVLLVNYLVPWKEDISAILGPTAASVHEGISWYSLRQYAWPPMLGGILMGLMQVPSVLATGTVLGASSSYTTVVRFAAERVDRALGCKLFSCHTGHSAVWTQVLFGLGAVCGAIISVDASGFVYPPTSIPALHSVVGGILLVLGARTAGGCTSGHGLSGLGQLSVSSLISTAAMFAGEMLTALFL